MPHRYIYGVHAPPKFVAANFKQMALSCGHRCCSARERVVATVSTLTSSHNFASHSSFNLSKPKRSAAANRCCIIIVEVQVEVEPVISTKSGSSSE